MEFDAVKRTLETNLFGAWRLCQAFIPLMRERGFGRIVNVSSGAGRLTDMNGRLPSYRVSKTALNAVTRILADELIGSGILVNAADVGWVVRTWAAPKSGVALPPELGDHQEDRHHDEHTGDPPGDPLPPGRSLVLL